MNVVEFSRTTHIPGGNIAMAYFRPQLRRNWNSTQTSEPREEFRIECEHVGRL
jgi:hypothetical protein